MNILFFGTPEFAVSPLQALLALPDAQVVAVITQPDGPGGRGQRLQESPVKRVALESGILVLQPANLRRSPYFLLENLPKDVSIDISVVVAFGQILPQEVLRFPRLGSLNIHASLLPRWRGAAPIHRAIMAGDSETGVCLMQMDEGLDTGPVFTSASMPIASGDTAGELHNRLSESGAELLRAALPKIVRGELQATSQKSDGVTYAKKISPEETRIDWSASSTDVARKVHGLSPFPGAYTTFEGKRLKLFRASASREAPRAVKPGEVLIAEGARLEVCCGSGTVELSELQLEGKKRLQAEEFLRGISIYPGVILGGRESET